MRAKNTDEMETSKVNLLYGLLWKERMREDKQKISGGKNFLLCVHIYVYAWVLAGTHVFMCVCMHVEAQDWCQESITVHLRLVISVTRRAHWLASLANQLVLGSSVFTFQGLNYRLAAKPIHHLYRVWGSELWSTQLQGRCFFLWSHFGSPQIQRDKYILNIFWLWFLGW